MAISFPSSPTNGQKFDSGTTRYTYSTATGAWSAAPLGTALPFNYLINPNMAVSQQNANTAVSGLTTNAVAYPADQWLLCMNAGSGVASTQRVQVATANGSVDRIRSTVTTGTTVSGLQGDYYFAQHIEGTRVADLLWGTASARQVILRFGFKAPAGTYTIAIRNAHPTAARTYLAAFTVTAGQANTDTIQTIVIPGDTTGTWAKDTSLGMTVVVQMAGAGALGINGNAGWNAGNFSYIFGQTTGTKTAGWVYELFDAGLYADPNLTGRAPLWDAPVEQTSMMAAQRYWYKAMNLQGFTSSASLATRLAAPHPVTMRAAPTPASVAALVYDATVNNAATQSTNYSNINGAEFQASSSGLTALRAASHVGGAAAYFAMNARL